MFHGAAAPSLARRLDLIRCAISAGSKMRNVHSTFRISTVLELIVVELEGLDYMGRVQKQNECSRRNDRRNGSWRWALDRERPDSF